MRSKTALWRMLLVVSISLGVLTFGGADSLAMAGMPSVADAVEAADAQDGKTAYIVVRFANDDTIVRSVTFTETITALDALEATGLAYTTDDTGFGPFLCSIEEVGDSSPACDNGNRYWATYQWTGDAWEPRMVGIADAEIANDGHVEGFSWSDPSGTPVDPPPAPQLIAAQRALDWLLQQEQEDGGYGSAGNTAEVLIALAANRQEVAEATVANMLASATEFAADPSGAGKLALALTAHGICWPYGVPQPLEFFDSDTGSFDPGAAPHALAMLGTAALDQTIPPLASAHLLDQQQPDGGWEWSAGWGTDTNSTALAIQALVAAGEPVTSTAIISATNYLAEAQNDDGGFPYSPTSEWGTDSDSNSTAYVVEALLAIGEDPSSDKWVVDGNSPISYLLDMQLEDGSFEWQPDGGPNQSSTQQVVPALLGRLFPLARTELAPCEPQSLPASGGTGASSRPATERLLWVSTPDGSCVAR
ncbi:MAG: prenyltransferase/squalene oxidase repeat-containing protein [Anaerolineae bacterium]